MKVFILGLVLFSQLTVTLTSAENALFKQTQELTKDAESDLNIVANLRGLGRRSRKHDDDGDDYSSRDYYGDDYDDDDYDDDGYYVDSRGRTTYPEQTTSSSSSSTSTTTIISIIVVTLVVIAILSILACCCKNKRSRQSVADYTRADSKDRIVFGSGPDTLDYEKFQQNSRPGSAQSMVSLRNTQIGFTLGLATCSICLDSIDQKSEKVLQCGHQFHSRCIRAWGQRSNSPTCPLCRHNL